MQVPRMRPHLTLPRTGPHWSAHSRENTLAAIAFVCGIAAFFTGFVATLHLLASVVGVIGFVEGLYAQLVSDTTAERMFIVVGIVGSFVGLGLGLAHGGFLTY